MSVCLICLSVRLSVADGRPNGWADEDQTWHGDSLPRSVLVLTEARKGRDNRVRSTINLRLEDGYLQLVHNYFSYYSLPLAIRSSVCTHSFHRQFRPFFYNLAFLNAPPQPAPQIHWASWWHCVLYNFTYLLMSKVVL